MNAAIETLGLTKTYRTVIGRVVAVDRIDLNVSARGLHVLLGPAKAGKSTLLRLLVGLAWPDAGAARVLGVPAPDTGRELAGRVGTVIGEPDFVERLSGRRNLLMHPAATSKAQADHVLKQAGLANVAQDAVGSYAPGARRRLAIAAGLLAGSELLLVDDATRGLDAEGTREVRTLLRKLADRGPAVVLTSDNLVEAQQIADNVTVLSAGRALADGSASEVIGEVATSVRVRVDDPKRAVAELTAAKFTVTRDGGLVVVDGVAEPADVTKALARKKLYVTEMSTRAESLEALVRRLTPEPEPKPAEPTRAERRAARQEAAAKKKAAEKKAADKKAAEEKAAAEKAAAVKAAEKAARKKVVAEKVVDEKVAAETTVDAKAVARKRAADEKAVGKKVASAKGKEAPPEPSPPDERETPSSWRARRRAAFEADAAAKRDRYAARVAEREQAAAEKEEALRAKKEAQEEREFERLLRAEEKAARKEARRESRKEQKESRGTKENSTKENGTDEKEPATKKEPAAKGSRTSKAKALLGARAGQTQGGASARDDDQTDETGDSGKTDEPGKEET